MSTKDVVVVAMSGGVDSSVAAALLSEQGYSVVGMMLRLWSEQTSADTNRCCTPAAIAMARRVASLLSIPFYVLDARQVFYDSVVMPFINDYAHGLTPNPCISCNRTVRWDYLFKQAMTTGAEFLATGHYARIAQSGDNSFQLLRGVDPAKDQSYVLHVLSQHHLQHALFPLGEYTKAQVRQLAHKYSLPVSERPDSQDLCFIGDSGDYRHFLLDHAPQALIPGKIIDLQGNILGFHRGLANFTIGQRKGIGVASPTPLYVLEKDLSANALIVGPHVHSGSCQLIADNMNWLAGCPPKVPFNATVKIRYKSRDLPCIVDHVGADRVHIKLEDPAFDITPGQAAVLYNGEVCLGGGIISDELE